MKSLVISLLVLILPNSESNKSSMAVAYNAVKIVKRLTGVTFKPRIRIVRDDFCWEPAFQMTLLCESNNLRKVIGKSHKTHMLLWEGQFPEGPHGSAFRGCRSSTVGYSTMGKNRALAARIMAHELLHQLNMTDNEQDNARLWSNPVMSISAKSQREIAGCVKSIRKRGWK